MMAPLLGDDYRMAEDELAARLAGAYAKA